MICDVRQQPMVVVMVLGSCWLADPAAAQDKSQYSLFRPVPDALLRDLTTDRPDATESPFTVDPGRIQVETNVFGYTRSRRDANGEVTESHEFGNTNIRLGLTHNAEVNFIWQPYGTLRTRASNGVLVNRQSGTGSVDIRGKINLWGNDSFERPGATAFALLPYLTLPTNRSNGISADHVEGGLILPFAVKLNEKFGLGLNTGVAAIRNPAGTGYNTEWLASASLSYEWSDRIGTYYEIACRFISGDAVTETVNFGTGVTYKLSKNFQLDAGVNFGLTRASDRVNPFVGFSARY